MKKTKEQQAYASYIWTCAEIGNIKRKIIEYERILKLLEDTKKDYEKIEYNKRNERKKERI